MCGRLVVTTSTKELAIVAHAAPGEMRAPRYNLAPAQEAPAVLNEMPRVLRWIRWGLVPAWAKDASVGSRMINARAETLATKPAFARLLEQRRCVVVADGFYEWAARPGEKTKQPWFIHHSDRTPLALAGLWDRWRSPQGEEWTTCTLITTAANPFMRRLHDRMPVLLHDPEIEAWLDPAPRPPDSLAACLKPLPDETLSAHPVGSWVNRVSTDDARCLDPVSLPPEQPELF